MTGVWWDDQINPVSGCTKISEACQNCYAEALHSRYHAARQPLGFYKNPFNKVTLQPQQLQRFEQLVRTKQSRVVFIGNMCDLFHDEVPMEYQWKVFDLMVTCPQHTFVLLTKRPQNMMKAVLAYGAPWDANILWPRLFPNVWLGVTVENQERADERVPILLNTPAAHRWLSAEPLLGPIDLLRMCREQVGNPRSAANHGALEKLDLVICGGESGRNARLMRPGWPKYLKYQCDASGVRFHFKQYGDNYLKGDYQAGSSQVFEGVDYSVLKPEAIWKVTA